MKNFTVALFAGLISLAGIRCTGCHSGTGVSKAQNDYNVIYASKGFCFKDKDAKEKFGNENCYTSKPKFSEKSSNVLMKLKSAKRAEL